jgi:hypothetical protein
VIIVIAAKLASRSDKIETAKINSKNQLSSNELDFKATRAVNRTIVSQEQSSTTTID